MSDTADTIDSREAFTDRLTELINAAEQGGVLVEGAYDIETTQNETVYDVEMSAVGPELE